MWKSVVVALLAAAAVTGCGTQALWVNCQGKLEPINRPAPKTEAAPDPQDPANVGQTRP
jgi:hypothetical protein